MVEKSMPMILPGLIFPSLSSPSSQSLAVGCLPENLEYIAHNFETDRFHLVTYHTIASLPFLQLITGTKERPDRHRIPCLGAASTPDGLQQELHGSSEFTKPERTRRSFTAFKSRTYHDELKGDILYHTSATRSSVRLCERWTSTTG